MEYNALFNHSLYGNHSDDDAALKVMTTFSYACSFFVLLLFGVPGGLLGSILIQRSSHAHPPYRIHLLVAVTDLLNVLALLLLVVFASDLRFLTSLFGVDDWHLSTGVRGIMLYEAHYAIPLVNLFTMASAYLMVFIMVDRIQAYRSPYEYERVSQPERLNVMGIFSYVIAVFTSLHEGFMQKVCVTDLYHDTQAVWPNAGFADSGVAVYLRVATFAARAIAVLIISLLLVALAYLACCQQQQRNGSTATIVRKPTAHLQAVTAMAVCKCVMCVLVLSPQLAGYACLIFTTNQTAVRWLTAVCVLCTSFGASFNIVLYTATAHDFRSRLATCLCGCCCSTDKADRVASSTSASTSWTSSDVMSVNAANEDDRTPLRLPPPPPPPAKPAWQQSQRAHAQQQRKPQVKNRAKPARALQQLW